jgi:penicillin-binding protein 1C
MKLPLVAIALLTPVMAWFALLFIPLPPNLERGIIPSIEFVDRDGAPLRTLLVEQHRYARRVALAQISPVMIQATISAEDARFYHHPGIDSIATARAGLSFLRRHHIVSGASTITQQVIKLSANSPRNFMGKVYESILALRLEQTWTKKRILEEYLNRLDYGNLQIGIAAASNYYFHKPPGDMSPAEAAFLAGLPRAPSRLDPYTNVAGAQARQRWVLGRMRARSVLDAESFARAQSEPLQIAPPQHEFLAPHFVDLLLQRRGLLPQNGGTLRTALCLSLNQEAELALNDQLAHLLDKHATAGACVVIDNRSGDVLALAGSGDYFRPGTNQINGAWSARSPGSALKPFTYALALERGLNPCSIVADVPTEFTTPTGIYAPSNYNHQFYGPVSLRFALGNSLNVASIRTLQAAGGPDVLHRKLRELGITTLDHAADFYGLGLTLGNAEVRLLELANAYATLARLGIFRPYRLLRDRPGEYPDTRVFQNRAAYLIADMLGDNGARAASFGLESFLAFDFPVACKTGTSSNYRDNWAFAFTPEFTVGVWIGNHDGSPMQEITGVTGAAPVMHQMMVYLHEHFGTSWFAAPTGIREFVINPLNGKQTTARTGLPEKCLSEPQVEGPADCDEQGRIILGREYEQWLHSAQNNLGNLVTCEGAAGKFAISGPAPGALFFLDPDIPASDQRVILSAPGEVEWASDLFSGKLIGDRQSIPLRSGVHQVTARNIRSGATAQTWIDVREL